MVAQVTFRILKSREKVSTKLMLLVYPLVPYVCLLIQWWTGIAVHSMQPLAMCSALVFHYTNVYVRVEQLTARREQALMESQLRTLQAQVNPHFIYNALSSVASLCDSDPAAAQEMVYRLSDYLHDHFSGMGQPSLIPFQEAGSSVALYRHRAGSLPEYPDGVRSGGDEFSFAPDDPATPGGERDQARNLQAAEERGHHPAFLPAHGGRL